MVPTKNNIARRDTGTDCDFEPASEDEAELTDFVQIHVRSHHDATPSEDDVRRMTKGAE